MEKLYILLLFLYYTAPLFSQTISFENNLSMEANTWNFPKLNSAPRDFISAKNIQFPSDGNFFLQTNNLPKTQYLQAPDGGKVWIFEDGGYVWDLQSGCKLEVWSSKVWKYSCKNYIAEKLLQGKYGEDVRITFPDNTQSIQRKAWNNYTFYLYANHKQKIYETYHDPGYYGYKSKKIGIYNILYPETWAHYWNGFEKFFKSKDIFGSIEKILGFRPGSVSVVSTRNLEEYRVLNRDPDANPGGSASAFGINLGGGEEWLPKGEIKDPYYRYDYILHESAHQAYRAYCISINKDNREGTTEAWISEGWAEFIAMNNDTVHKEKLFQNYYSQYLNKNIDVLELGYSKPEVLYKYSPFLVEYLYQKFGNKKLQLFLTELCSTNLDWREVLKNQYLLSTDELNRNSRDYFQSKKSFYESQYANWRMRK